MQRVCVVWWGCFPLNKYLLRLLHKIKLDRSPFSLLESQQAYYQPLEYNREC